jgi:hypothetical protein
MKDRPEYCLKGYCRLHFYLIGIWVFCSILRKEGKNALYGGLVGYTVPQIRIIQYETREISVRIFCCEDQSRNILIGNQVLVTLKRKVRRRSNSSSCTDMCRRSRHFLPLKKTNIQTPWFQSAKRTIPTERPPHVGEVSANLSG